MRWTKPILTVAGTVLLTTALADLADGTMDQSLRGTPNVLQHFGSTGVNSAVDIVVENNIIGRAHAVLPRTGSK